MTHVTDKVISSLINPTVSTIFHFKSSKLDFKMKFYDIFRGFSCEENNKENDPELKENGPKHNLTYLGEIYL
jgi:hypothetical protein